MRVAVQPPTRSGASGTNAHGGVAVQSGGPTSSRILGSRAPVVRGMACENVSIVAMTSYGFWWSST